MPRDNDIIPVEHLKELVLELQDEEKQTLKKVLRVAPDRLHTLIPGMLILNTICRVCGCEEIAMSSYGVREGYLYKKAVIGK